jgi:hypothetical protein
MIKKDKKQKAYIDIMNPPEVLDKLDIERQMWRAATQKHREEVTFDLAKKMKAKFRTDPFIYNKVVSWMLYEDMYTPEDIRAQLKGK